MAIKIRSGYLCSYCNKLYKKMQDADVCRESHNLILVPMTAEDLNRLRMFIYLKQEELLTPTLIRTINRYSNKRRLE